MRMMRGRLARSSLQTSVVLGLRVATQAATLLLLVRLFDPQVYGNLVAAATLAVVLGILPSLGSGFVLMARTPGNSGATADVWRYAWPMTASLGLLLLACYLPAARLLGGQDALPWRVLFWIGATELLLMPFTMLLSHALQARERVPLSQLLQWVPLGLRVLAVLPCFLVSPEERLALYAGLQFAATLLGLSAAFWIASRHVTLAWRPRRPTAQELRDGASYAGMTLVAANTSEIDKIMAVRVVGAHDAGLYNAMARVMVAMVMPVLAMLASAQPRLFQHAHAPSPQGRHLVRILALVAAAWGIASCALLVVCSPLLPLLFGPAYGETAKLMPWVALTAPFLALRFAAGTILVALGRPLERVAFEVIGVGVLVVGILALSPTWNLLGVIAATIISETAMATTGWWLVVRRMRSGPLLDGDDHRVIPRLES